ncbi:cytochrome o ubiquinol oxidase subunit IV [Caulobacter sp. 17J65-9]|uniref:cytochrome o ubiquinol oxidase subunit IV n=1 Tax=Caulobacter sp. 17J65-9 TaxID=2709382 RepID=UPI0013CB3093|nr:cytochrome o ubiquinol oxidase subunit IV [Caulobacter sp. 17J65-9]NEX93219.1 cytochrome o ubiquinol oxidase subunit IV [Caulobacter sp. 17J65-9]
MSELDYDPHDLGHDHAPGDEPAESAGHWVMNYSIGLALATILTVGSFILPALGLVWGPSLPVALIVLAIAQMGVHLVFFLHITTGPDNTNNVLALAFGVMMVGLLVIGSIWIMANMHHYMAPMPPEAMTHMQAPAAAPTVPPAF